MTVTICALMWSHPGSDERLHSQLAESLSSVVASFGGTPVSLYRRKEGSIGPLEVLTIRWPSREALEHYRATTDAVHAASVGTDEISHLVICYEEPVRSSTNAVQDFRATLGSEVSPVTVCVLVWSHAGQDLLLSAYADRALANAQAYGARVIQRLRRLPGSSGPLETQIIEFPSEELLAEYREAQRVDEFAQIRNTAIANWLLFPVESMLELAMPTL
ncbi:MAG TPA: hypothetical protein DDY88_03570 [Actinobacteria bacterium]|nr:hypothetical protein [Actinomycetota bacterium]